MLLKDKNAVIYGAGGSIGGAVAKEFAREGARVFLAGRTRNPLEAVAADISSVGGSAEVAVLDALDEEAVDEHARAMASEAGSIDVSFNLITRGDVQGIPLIEMTTDDLLHAVLNIDAQSSTIYPFDLSRLGQSTPFADSRKSTDVVRDTNKK